MKNAFPGIEDDAGEFRARLRLVAFAVALKRRVAVLQAVDHAQRAPGNTLERFTQALEREQQAVDQFEADVRRLVQTIAGLQLVSPRRFIDNLMMRHEVDELLRWPNRLRDLADAEGEQREAVASDMVVSMLAHRDGTVRVFSPRMVAG